MSYTYLLPIYNIHYVTIQHLYYSRFVFKAISSENKKKNKIKEIYKRKVPQIYLYVTIQYTSTLPHDIGKKKGKKNIKVI